MRIAPCCIALLLLAVPAYARPPQEPAQDPVIRSWFESLHRDLDNTPCCAESDCRMVDEFKMTDGNYVVKARRKDFVMNPIDAEAWDRAWPGKDETWIAIPPGKLSIRTDNPTGSAVLCYSVLAHQVFCYVPWDEKY